MAENIPRSAVSTDAIRKALENDCVAIAAITLWELRWLATTRRIDPGGTITSFLEKITSGIVVLPLNSDIAAQAAAFPIDRYPKDLADRLIGATALVTGISLITKNDAIRKSQFLRTVW